MTICSTCQGVISQANHRVVNDQEYLDEINAELAEEGLHYSGKTEVKHLLWILLEDIGVEKLQNMFNIDLSGFNFAPFYGCYIIRPSDALGITDNPQRKHSLDIVIESTGAQSTDAEVLEELSRQSHIPKLILEIRQKSKIKNTYLDKILPQLDLDSRLRTGFNLHGTTSGRLSSSGKLNMQQLPRDNPIVKGCIKAAPGNKIVAMDLTCAEVYVAGFCRPGA